MPHRFVDIHPLAYRELQSAFKRYAKSSRRTAQRFRHAVFTLVQSIADDAEMGTPFRSYFWWRLVKRFPYVVYYEIRDPQPVLIYSIAHARRRPGYWLRRTQD